MILSFSHVEMLPYIRAGILQAKGENVGGARVKRQTIRRWGPQAERIMDWPSPVFPYRLSLWWKSRTKEREFLDVFEAECVQANTVLIEHAKDGRIWIVLGAQRQITWHPEQGDNGLSDFAYADGFDSPEAFRDFFVPEPGDVFKGVLYKW